MANLTIASLALDPSDTQYNTLYAGTGEGFKVVDGVRGAGIFKTTNGGASLWRTTNAKDDVPCWSAIKPSTGGDLISAIAVALR